MRISGLALARILDHNGNYALILNKGELDRSGRRVLSPIGGGLEIMPRGKEHLTSLGGTDFEGQGHEIRLRVPNDRVADVIAWFRQGQDRERTITRELFEELVDETKLLDPDDLRSVMTKYRDYFRDNKITPRLNVPERQTAYLIETHDVQLGVAAMRKLTDAACRPIGRRAVYFVTQSEIDARRTKEGIEITQHSRFVL